MVAAEPDERPTTDELRLLCEALDERPDVSVHVWFLRDYHRRRWPGTRNVDALRTWWASRLLEAVRLGIGASWLRGRRLRRWFADIDPDAVLLDDGVGARLLPSAPRPPLVIERRNPVAGLTYGFVEPTVERPDIVVSYLAPPAARDGVESPAWFQVSPFLDDWHDLVELGRRAHLDGRERLGLPPDVPLVVGWGDAGWVDGSDIFVRTLWYLQDRHGIAAHGLWLGPLDDAVEVQRLTSEAERCGVADRLHLRDDTEPESRWCGDVAFLPSRVPVDALTLATAAACDQAIVTFGPAVVEAPWIRVADYLDLPGAAAHLATSLRDDREPWSTEVDRRRLIDRLVGTVDSLARP